MKRLACSRAFLFAGLVSLLMNSARADAPRISLEVVATGLPSITDITHANDASGRLFVSLKDGRLMVVEDGVVQATPFLDLRAAVGSEGFEQGLLGTAFHPDYENNGLFFVSFTALDGDLQVFRFQVSADPQRADRTSAMPVLEIPQPGGFHNGGAIRFGPDGMLYLATGDGQGGEPFGVAQALDSGRGKLLRLDMDSGSPYGIPPDNPFVGVAGTRPEIWAYGFRNPWRFSFDRLTGDLFLGDVGENRLEEVNFQAASSSGGENYGWKLIEGTLCFEPPANCDDGSLVPPILTYGHDQGDCSVIAGYRYRGPASSLEGTYFFGDFCSGRIFGASQTPGGWETCVLLDRNHQISTFGEDEQGELYVADYDAGRLLRVTEVIPEITANGQTQGIVVGTQDPVELSLSLDPGIQLGQSVDYWIGVLGPGGPRLLAGATLPLMDLDSISFLDTPLPEGLYLFFFALDSTPDGAFAPGWISQVLVQSGGVTEELPDLLQETTVVSPR